MSTTTQETLPIVTNNDNDDDDNLEHYYCPCNPDIALCELDISDAPDHTLVETPPEEDCVVCIDLIDVPCSRCGD